MFTLGYYSNDDPSKTVKTLDTTYHNIESAKSEGKNLQKHPAFTFKTVVVIDTSQKRAYSL